MEKDYFIWWKKIMPALLFLQVREQVTVEQIPFVFWQCNSYAIKFTLFKYIVQWSSKSKWCLRDLSEVIEMFNGLFCMISWMHTIIKRLLSRPLRPTPFIVSKVHINLKNSFKSKWHHFKKI